MSDEHNNTLFVELSKDGTYWNVNSGGIFRTRYSKNKKKVEPLPTIGNSSNAEAAGVNHGTTEGETVTSENSPMTSSVAKVQQNPETSVNNSEKLKLSDGRDVPLDEKGEPDFMKMEAKDGAEVYQTLFPDTYEAEIDNAVKSAEKALRDAKKMKPKGKGIMERAKEQQTIKATIALAEQQLEKAKAIKRSLTEQKVASTIESQKPTVEPSKEISDEVRDKFQNAPKVKGTEGSITLPDGTEIDGTYYLVSSESLTPSHDANNGYKANEGLPTNPDGGTLNDRDYEHDKSYRLGTDEAARSYDGRALNDVPIISDEGFVYSGNGRTMAGQKAAVEGTDGKYIDNLKKNAGRFGLTREQIENSGIEHPRVVFVPKERLPYDTATMRKFNKEDKKSESNVAEAVANSKTLTSTDVGSIIAAIEGSGKDGAVGTIESFFNSPKAISGLIKTLQEKGILGSNEVAKYMDGDLLSAQGKEYVKNLLLGSMFKEETIRMMGIESTLKNKAISAMRTIMENQKLGDYSLRDEIDQAIKLLYEAKTKGDKVDTLLRTIDAFNGNAADRYPSISQMMAIALEGKVGDFRDLLDSYNRNAAQHNTNEGSLFGDKPTKEEFINEFLNFKNWKDYGTRHSEEKADAHVGGIQGNEPQAPGANGERPTTETKQGVEPLKTNNDGRQEETANNLRQQKADTPSEISEREAALRDAVISKIKQSGIEVVTDVEEGQRMLDLANDVFLSKGRNKKSATETALPRAKAPFKDTVVSSADGAKVLKNADTLVKSLENSPEEPLKNFIGYVAKAFGMERPATSSSQYATFETVNGDVVTFRLSDHNARQSGFDGAGRDNGISIVISRKSNNGITEDGDAHIVEFYYSDKALRQAQGHPLAEIVKSMKQALYSGEYNDTTGLAERGEVPSGVIREMKAYHGSGADFDHFDHSHMGEGEGAQSFGWGTYVTDVEEVGRYYAEGNTQDYNNPIIRAYFKAVRNEVENGVPFEEAKQKTLTILDKLRKGIEGKEDAYASFIAAHERFKGLKEEDLFNRHLYTVEIPDDNGKNYLEWDKEYNENEVYEIVERMLDKAVEYEKRGDWDNGEKFRDVANALAERIDKEVSDKDGKGTLSGELLYYNVSTDAKTASELLNEAGFVGIKYPAGYFSGGNPEGNKNYVIFNEADAKITDHIRYFKTKSGHAYGYTDGKKIYIDPRIATSETPIHEYTHLWATALKNTNQKGWADVVRLMKGTDVWNKVTEKYPELKTDDEIADEVLAQFSGKRGAERLRQMAEGINPGDVMKKTEVLSTVGKIKQALEKFWNYVKEDILGIQRRFKSAEEIADSVMKDLMDGVNPTKKATEEGSRLQKEEVKNGEDNKTAKELFLSLQNKTDNKDYNGTVTNLARRVAEGKARVVRFGTRAERKEPGDAPTTAGYLFATGTDGLHLGSGAIPTKDYSFPLGKGETTSIRITVGDTSTTREGGFGEVAKDDGTSIEKLRNDIYNRLEDWSKENGYLFNETDVEKNSLDGKKWEEGCEAVVYRSKDDRNVVKVSAIDPYYANGLLRMIDRAAAHKMVFPDTAYTIKGYGREKNGKFSVVTEQPFVEGKTVIEYFNGDLRKANEYIDNYMRSIGFKEKYDRDYDDTVWSNGKYTVYDTNASNVIIDKEGKPHVIDCEVLPVGYSKIDKFEIVDAKGGTHFRESNAPQQSHTQEVVSNHIDQVAKKVGGKVKKVNTIEEVTNTNARKAIEEGRKITGWYDIDNPVNKELRDNLVTPMGFKPMTFRTGI